MHIDPIHSLFIGSKVISLPSCHSTNQVASDLLSAGKATDGMVITTNSQTAGKGPRGNTWESEPGKNLTLSVVVKPNFIQIESQFDLTVIASLSVVKTLQGMGLPDALIKWPNDIYYQGSKLGGILIENTVRSNRLEWSVIGIGLNINQKQFQVRNATSMAVLGGRDFKLKQVQDDLIEHLNHYYRKLKSGKSV